MPTKHVFEFLSDPKLIPKGTCPLFGDEPFLRRLARNAIIERVVGVEDDVPFTTLDGATAEWRDVADELFTVSLFGDSARLVIVDDADSFVSRYRDKLEAFVEKPAKDGLLVLEVGTWPGNTRLYKRLHADGLQVECKAPVKGKSVSRPAIAKWLEERAKSELGRKLDRAAATLLIELRGEHFGLLDQELNKLALYGESSDPITPEMVRDYVGGWRTQSMWEIADKAAEGKASDAIEQLDRLIQSGESPIGLFAQLAWALRRFASAGRIYESAERSGKRVKLRDALIQAGFREWPANALTNAERNLKQIGRQRASRLHQWLTEIDLATKGTHSDDRRARWLLERLILQLSRETSGRQVSA